MSDPTRSERGELTASPATGRGPDGNAGPPPRSDETRVAACNPPSWEIKRKIGAGSYRVYAHGYFAPTWSVTIFTRKRVRTIIGRKRIERAWANVA